MLLQVHCCVTVSTLHGSALSLVPFPDNAPGHCTGHPAGHVCEHVRTGRHVRTVHRGEGIAASANSRKHSQDSSSRTGNKAGPTQPPAIKLTSQSRCHTLFSRHPPPGPVTCWLCFLGSPTKTGRSYAVCLESLEACGATPVEWPTFCPGIWL